MDRPTDDPATDTVAADDRSRIPVFDIDDCPRCGDGGPTHVRAGEWYDEENDHVFCFRCGFHAQRPKAERERDPKPRLVNRFSNRERAKDFGGPVVTRQECDAYQDWLVATFGHAEDWEIDGPVTADAIRGHVADLRRAATAEAESSEVFAAGLLVLRAEAWGRRLANFGGRS